MLPVLPGQVTSSGTECMAGGTLRPEAGVARESLTVAGQPERVDIARAFVGAMLGPHPCAEIAVLLVSELVTNSIRHSDSRLPGEVVIVSALADDHAVRVEVTDRSGPTVPKVRDDADAMAEGGRGLHLVDTLSAAWGYRRSGGRTTTWFECTA